MEYVETEFLIEAFDEPVFLLDQDRHVLAMNGSATDFFGQVPNGSDLARAFRNPRALRYVDMSLAGDIAEQSKEYRKGVELQITRAITTDFRMKIARVSERTAEDKRYLLVMKDVSHIVEAEQMRSDFVANVSHELRSPLTAILGFIETLAGPAKDDEKASERFLSIMEQEATRMNRIIDDLLSLSKVEINARVRPTSTADLQLVAKRVIETLEPQAKSKTQTISFRGSSDSALVNGDEDQIVQVIQNLLENAIKYSSEESEIKVELKRYDRVTGMPEGAVSVSIQDQGEGIPAEHIPRLTERFYRVDKGRSRQKGGTGLGLAIVKHIVNRHRGKFVIESEVGQGSTFEVFLPFESERVS